MRRTLVVLPLLAIVCAPAGSHAAAQVIVAAPGAQGLGIFDAPYVDDATPTSVAVKAAPLEFVNLDPLANGQHNAESIAKGPDTNCTGEANYLPGKCPLWHTKLVGLGGTSSADLSKVPPGLYPFVCKAHFNMKGVLRIVA